MGTILYLVKGEDCFKRPMKKHLDVKEETKDLKIFEVGFLTKMLWLLSFSYIPKPRLPMVILPLSL